MAPCLAHPNAIRGFAKDVAPRKRNLVWGGIGAARDVAEVPSELKELRHVAILEWRIRPKRDHIVVWDWRRRTATTPAQTTDAKR